jgi:hypothetical protein
MKSKKLMKSNKKIKIKIKNQTRPEQWRDNQILC